MVVSLSISKLVSSNGWREMTGSRSRIISRCQVVLNTAVCGLAIVVMLLQHRTHVVITVSGISRVICCGLMMVV
jgi:hypothetical protein